MNRIRATRLRRAVAGLAAATGLAACGGGGDSFAGLCDPEISDPSVTVVSASSSGDGSAIGTVRFSALGVGGVPFAFSALLLTSNLLVNGDVATCSVPCAFGSSEGTYVFRAEADGYAAKAVTVDVKYRLRAQDGCRLRLEGGATIALRLDPVT